MTSPNSINGLRGERPGTSKAVEKRPPPSSSRPPPSLAEHSEQKSQPDTDPFLRMALRGALATLFAHELNNIFTPILARTEIALESNDPAFQRTALQKTLANAQRASALAAKMLGTAAPSPVTVPESSKLLAALDQAIEDLPRACEKDGIEIVKDVAPELLVSASHELCNALFLNALLYLRERMRGSSGEIKITARETGGAITVELTDSGPQATQAQLDASVNAFFHEELADAPAAWDAFGPHLAMCRWVAREAHATVELRANKDRGIRFHIGWKQHSC